MDAVDKILLEITKTAFFHDQGGESDPAFLGRQNIPQKGRFLSDLQIAYEDLKLTPDEELGELEDESGVTIVKDWMKSWATMKVSSNIHFPKSSKFFSEDNARLLVYKNNGKVNVLSWFSTNHDPLVFLLINNFNIKRFEILEGYTSFNVGENQNILHFTTRDWSVSQEKMFHDVAKANNAKVVGL